MSNNSVTCRDKYYNYGSYLRSRGYDREICHIINLIESGQISTGPIQPNGDCGVTINGTTTIQDCAGDPSNANYSGVLKVTGGVDTNLPTEFSISANHGMNLIGPVYQNYGLDISYSVGGTTYHGNVFSADEHIFTDHSANTEVIVRGATNTDILRPNKLDVYGISYETPSLARQSYIFGQGFAMGDISGQTIPTPINNFKYGCQYLTVTPQQLRINAMGNPNLLKLGGTAPNNYLVLDVSNNHTDVRNSVFSFNANITFTNSVDHLAQTVLFLHPGDAMTINQASGAGKWPDVDNGDIIIDTRSLGTTPSSVDHATATYGERQVFNGDTIPATHGIVDSFASKFYTPHIAILYVNQGQSVVMERGNLSMKQMLFK
jgi:hypothetical protein